jgi:ribosomal protein S18 acetylase RimI-like enzyme
MRTRGLRLQRNGEASGLEPEEIERLTERAIDSTFYADTLSPLQVEANRRIPSLAREVFFKAAASEHQHLAAAVTNERLAGFMIATRHGQDDLELDWLMVDPAQHGAGLAAALMTEGVEWLGSDRPIWLTVLKHNWRAIRFYRKFGFEIDEGAELDRIVPTWIMRRPGVAADPPVA